MQTEKGIWLRIASLWAQLCPFPLENSTLKAWIHYRRCFLCFPWQVPQCHLQVSALWYTLTSWCLTRVVHRAGLLWSLAKRHFHPWAAELSCSNPPKSHQHTEIKRMGPQAYFWNSPTSLQSSLAEQGESHSPWIDVLQDTAAEKLHDLSSPGAGATAFEKKSQLQFLWTHSDQVFHQHFCFCGKLTYTSCGWWFEGSAGWVEQKLINGMRTIMNGTGRDKKCIQNVFNHVTQTSLQCHGNLHFTICSNLVLPPFFKYRIKMTF